MAKDVSPSGTMLSTTQAHERLVSDALMMLDYAVGSGVKAADGHPIPQDIITTIESTAAKLGMRDGKPGDATTLSTDDWAKFDLAYYDLATALTPVTAETLRNTAGEAPESRSFVGMIVGDSPALHFTRGLLLATLGFAIVVVLSNWYLNIIAVNPNTNAHLWDRTFFELLTPWMYGGLGACVYLLRSAHTYIYQRTFDVRRKPEYTNRIMLGAIAGGAIILFVNNIAGDDGTVIQLSSAALGFLAGYNTDLLFTAMERVIGALLPKIGIDTVQKAAPTKPADINDLMKHHANAKGTDKDFVKSVITHVTGMRGGKG
jgi:hypothetical protein